MIRLLRQFLAALTLALRALAPLLAEMAHERRQKRRAAEYKATVAAAGAALDRDAGDLAAFWSEFDDQLLSEGIGGAGRSESDSKATGRKLQGESGLDGQPSENGSGAQSGAS